MIEELNDISYSRCDYTLKEVFIEANNNDTIKKIDKKIAGFSFCFFFDF